MHDVGERQRLPLLAKALEHVTRRAQLVEGSLDPDRRADGVRAAFSIGTDDAIAISVGPI